MNFWLEQVFNARAAQCGGVVRRNVHDVDRYSSEHQLIEAVKARGFHLVQTGDQFVVICNGGDLRLIC